MFKNAPQVPRGHEAQILLLWHGRFDRWMIPGGHIEAYENCAEAATREVREETSLQVVLVTRLALEMGAEACKAVPMPWAIVEQRIPVHGNDPEHIHIDHLFVARPRETHAVPAGAEWFALSELGNLRMFEDTRYLAAKFAAALAADED